MSVTIYWRRWNEKQDSSHELLRQALERELQLDLPELVLEQGLKGKPRLLHWPEVHFSISHSEDLWGCAISDREIGLDLQSQYMKNNEKLARRFFHKEEIAWMEMHGFQEFSRIWTYKESYVKYTGLGLSDGLDYFSVVPWLVDETKMNSQIVKPGSGDEQVFQQEIPFLENYWMVLSTQKPEQVILVEMNEVE